jgi:hypothetical protein
MYSTKQVLQELQDNNEEQKIHPDRLEIKKFNPV